MTGVNYEVASTSATITGTTNNLSDGFRFGTTSSYGRQTPTDPQLLRIHTTVLTGLSPNTLYSFEVQGQDNLSNMVTRSGQFTTTAAPAGPLAGSL